MLAIVGVAGVERSENPGHTYYRQHPTTVLLRRELCKKTRRPAVMQTMSCIPQSAILQVSLNSLAELFLSQRGISDVFICG